MIDQPSVNRPGSSMFITIIRTVGGQDDAIGANGHIFH